MRTGSLLLLILTALTAQGCRSFIQKTETKMITRNDYAESVGINQMQKDANECGMHSVRENRRLTAQLYGDDSYFEEQARREGQGKAVGKEIGKEMASPSSSSASRPTTRKSGELNKERIAGDAAGALGGFIIGVLTSDADKHEQEMLALDIDSLEAYIRLKHACIRAKGYEVSEYEEDGAGTAHLLGNPLRVVLREEDGSEVIMYQRPKPEDQ